MSIVSVTLKLAVIAVFVLGTIPAAGARDGYPYSIMKEEPGTKPKAKPKPQSKPQAEPKKKEAKGKSGKKARGSSTLSTIPAYRSTVTPLGTAPDIIETPPMGRAASPGMIVPGVSGSTGGPVLTPPRPAGQGFQDRARNCFHAGSAAGVGAGQIGTYTRSCVNQ